MLRRYTRTPLSTPHVRSGLSAGVIWATFDVTGRLDLSLLCGTMSGCLVVLCGEALTPCLRELEQHAKAARVCSSTRAASQRKSGTRRSGAQLVDPGLLAIYGIGGAHRARNLNPVPCLPLVAPGRCARDGSCKEPSRSGLQVGPGTGPACKTRRQLSHAAVARITCALVRSTLFVLQPKPARPKYLAFAGHPFPSPSPCLAAQACA
eukprot:6175181-Pleurochrysis_carterae.AAC.7